MKEKASISEIYSSVQGEGPFTGERQVFVRFAGCPLRCDYCDTPGSLISRGHPELTIQEVMEKILKLSRRSGARTVSLTGGEPLAQAAFVESLARELKRNRLRVYLETAGVHPRQLKMVVSSVDVISMDIKLPKSTREVYWKEHRDFLRIGGRKVFVKIVVDSRSIDSEIRKAFRLLRQQPHPPQLILQPASSRGRDVIPPSADRLADLYQQAVSTGLRVLIMSQQHKLWGIP